MMKIHNALFAAGPPGAHPSTPGGPRITLWEALSIQTLNINTQRRCRDGAQRQPRAYKLQ